MKSVQTNEIIPQKLSLKSIYVGKARVYPILLPGKYKRDVDAINLALKLNFGVFLLTALGLAKKDKFVKSNELYNKIMFVGGIWYFSSIFLNWKNNAIYSEAYQNLASRYSEQEIVKMINDHSKKTKILV